MVDPKTNPPDAASPPELESRVYRSASDLNANQLNNLVAQADGGTLFHRHEWLAAVEASMDREPRHVLVTKKGNPVGFLPNFAVELPLPATLELPLAGSFDGDLADALPLEAVEPPPPGYGGPLVTSDRHETTALLLDRGGLTSGYRTVFHRVQAFDLDTVGYARQLEARGYEPRIIKCTFVVDLEDDWETVQGNMDSSRRRDMRNALDQDFEVEMSGLEDGLDRTYDMYVANMERVGGSILPRQFFEELADRMPDRIRVFAASVNGDEVGRYVHLLDEESDTLHHWLSAIADSDDFEYYPSELLHRSALQWGLASEYARYSFGPTNPHFEDSVFQFKAKYGATPVPNVSWERGTLPGVWHAYDYGRTLYRRSTVDAT